MTRFVDTWSNEHYKIASEIVTERIRQDKKWGEQNHEDGTGKPGDIYQAHTARELTESRFKTGIGTWKDILREEVYEAFAETDPDKLREELIQVAAVAASWVEAIDRRREPEHLHQGV